MTALCSGKICTIFPEKGALNFWKACTIALEYSHLSLLAEAKPITDLIESTQNEFEKELFRGFSEEERRVYIKLNDRMVENTMNAMKRRMDNE